MMIPALLFSYFKSSELERLSKTLAATFQFNETELPNQYARWRVLLNSSEKGGFPDVEEIALRFQSSDPKFQQFLEASQLVGVDLPSLLEHDNGNESKPTVMLVAQDPFRTTPKDGISLATPFALHSKGAREFHEGCRRAFKMVRVVLDLGYRVYLTDAWKIWVEGKTLPPGDRRRFIDVLASEIEIFQPAAIITWGGKAQNAIAQVHSKKQPLIASPHFSGAANGKWCELLKEMKEQGKFKDWDGRTSDAAKYRWWCEAIHAVLPKC